MADTSGAGSSGGFGSFNPYMGGAGALFGSGLGNLFSDWHNPMDAAMPYLNNAYGMIGGDLGSYMQHGNDMYGPLSDQLRMLMSDPSGRLNQIGAGYKQSPGLAFQTQQALQGAGHAAAAGGMAGTPMHQQQSMQLANDIANQDYNQWLSNALGLYGQGLGGAQNIYGIGAKSAGTLADLQAQLAASQAKLAYEGTNAQNQRSGGIWGSLLGGGLGFLAGGPAGAALGNKIGGWFS